MNIKRTAKFSLIGFVVFIVLIIILLISAVVGGNKSTTTPKNPDTIQLPEQSSQSKEEAQKELDSLMDVAKTAGVIHSYEFSDRASVVYADAIWYTQTVAFKKDFIAKVALLKEKITGYHNFEVRDAYSNEKLAEATAFSGSLEVYK